jgi:hypothetical protein
MYFPVEMEPGNAFILSDQPPPSLSSVPLASELQAQQQISSRPTTPGLDTIPVKQARKPRAKKAEQLQAIQNTLVANRAANPLPDPATLFPQPPMEHPEITAARAYGEQLAKDQTAKSKQTPLEIAKKQAKIHEENKKLYDMSDAAIIKKMPVSRKLNGYKKEYQGEIEFTFKRDGYSPEMPEDFLNQSLTEVRTVVNAGESIPYLHRGIKLVAKALAWVSTLALDDKQAQIINFDTFEERVAKKIEEGHFDSEIRQLKVEWAEYLAQGPVTRTMEKLGGLATEHVEESVKKAVPSMQQQKKVPRNVKTDDL